MDLKTENPEGRIREHTGDFEALSYSISQDLRTPLRAVTGFSQILLRNHSDRLFRMFQRLHPAEQFEGIGSGLAITRKISGVMVEGFGPSLNPARVRPFFSF